MIEVSNDEQIISALGQYREDQIAIDLSSYTINVELFHLINSKILKSYQIIPLLTYENYLIFASNDLNEQVKPIIELETGLKPIFIAAKIEQIKRILLFYFGSESPEKLFDSTKKNTSETDVYDEKTVVSKVNTLLITASQIKASDIHIYPEKKGYAILFRIDGVLHQMQSLTIDAATSIIARIKILANLNITEKQLPQDGNISLPNEKGKIDFRVSLIPTVKGDSLAIRVLDSIESIKDLNELGFMEDSTQKIKSMLGDSGIILVTGQTGSGKSTTIYALIKELMKKNLNIITIEDPVEYKLSGVRQIQIHEQIGYDFAYALRSILRHDPDVIVVGEIRDQKTAQIAIQSALTGHLVISTLHTNSAVGSITRLLDIGVPDYLLTSVIKGIIAQKLVRKVCTYCLGADKGCIECNHTGYSGRIPIYEILEITPQIAKLIAENASENKILNQAKDEDFIDIKKYAQILVDKNITDQKEANRKIFSYD